MTPAELGPIGDNRLWRQIGGCAAVGLALAGGFAAIGRSGPPAVVRTAQAADASPLDGDGGAAPLGSSADATAQQGSASAAQGTDGAAVAVQLPGSGDLPSLPALAVAAPGVPLLDTVGLAAGAQAPSTGVGTTTAAGTSTTVTTAAATGTVAAGSGASTGTLPAVAVPAVAVTPVPSGPVRYVDCLTGQDGGVGDAAHPWNTLRPLQSGLAAGTSVYLRRGCTWHGPVTLTAAATATAPVLVTGYGAGAAPVVDGSGLGRNEAAVTVASSYVNLVGLHITGGAGPGIVLNGSHASVVGGEIDHVAVGVRLMAPFGFVSTTAIHDLHMLVNTPGGDDDSGAIGFDIEADDVTVWRSSCTHCRAPSDDYGYDGGFADVFNRGSRLHLLENTASDVEGFLELGATTPGARADDVVVQGNVVTDTHGALWVHGSGTFTIGTARMVWHANTVRSTDPKALLGGDLSALSLTDNLFVAAGRLVESSVPAVHTGNRYQLTNGAGVGFPLGAGETASAG